MSENIKYEDIFVEDSVMKQQKVANILFTHFERRKLFVSPDSERLGPSDPRCDRASRPRLVIPEERRKRKRAKQHQQKRGKNTD